MVVILRKANFLLRIWVRRKKKLWCLNFRKNWFMRFYWNFPIQIVLFPRWRISINRESTNYWKGNQKESALTWSQLRTTYKILSPFSSVNFLLFRGTPNRYDQWIKNVKRSFGWKFVLIFEKLFGKSKGKWRREGHKNWGFQWSLGLCFITDLFRYKVSIRFWEGKKESSLFEGYHKSICWLN